MKKALIAAVALVAVLSAAWALINSRTWQLFGEIVPRVETPRKVVALTFDDGPQDAAVEPILAALGDVKATFFVCGAQVRDNRAAMARLVAAGHEIGNHSWSHQRMIFKSPSFIRREFEQTDAIIRASGYRGPIHVRAPYCKKLVGVPWYLARQGRIHVTFDVEPETSSRIDRDKNELLSHVIDKVRPGSIVLLHPWYASRAHIREILPVIVDELRAKGYEFVTVDQLLKLRDA